MYGSGEPKLQPQIDPDLFVGNDKRRLHFPCNLMIG